MIKTYICTISGVWCLAAASTAAAEIQEGVKYNFNVESSGKIYFQPQVPEAATEGEIWIDSKNGDRFFYIEGVWVSKDYRIAVTKPATQKN